MKPSGFNDDDPYHANAHLMFGFNCQLCDAELNIDEVAKDDLDDEFLECCVSISSLAKKSGWVSIEVFKFLCPNCAEAHNKRLWCQ